jgi:hypothetical protein
MPAMIGILRQRKDYIGRWVQLVPSSNRIQSTPHISILLRRSDTIFVAYMFQDHPDTFCASYR